MCADRILVVDDSPEFLDLLSEDILPQFGYETLSASSGQEALRLLSEDVPDLILLDVQMPDISGLEVLERIRERQIKVPVILMTAYGSEMLAVEAFRLGARDYLIKPFDASLGLASIERQLAQVRFEQEKEQLSRELEQARRDLEERVRELTVLFGISKSVTSLLDLDRILLRVVEAAVFIAKAEEGALWLLEPESDELKLYAQKGLEQQETSLQRLKIQDSVVGQVVSDPRPLRVASQADDDGLKIKTGYLAQALLAVPLMTKGQPFGVLLVTNRTHRRTFTAKNEAMLQALADYAAIAIENARAYQATDQALAQQVEEVTHLYNIARTLTSTLDQERLLDLVTAQINDMFRVEAGSVLLLDQDKEELRFVTNWLGNDIPLDGITLRLGQGIAGQVALTHQPAIANQAYQDKQFCDKVDKATGFVTRSILAVPLVVHDRCLGTIELLNKLDGPFTQSDVERLSSVASSVAIALENALLFQAAQELHESKSHFVAAMAAQLRSPLTTIKGYSDMLLADGIDTDSADSAEAMRAESVKHISASTDSLLALLEDLLDIARLETGETELELAPVSPREIATQVASSFEQRLKDKGMRMAVKVSPRLPQVYADQERASQVLSSLLLNAYLYTLPKGRITIEAQTTDSRWLRQDRSESVTFSVSDTGIGIAPEDQPRVFERFFRADHPVVQHHPGRGLSLSIAKSLVELYGGRIWFESEPGGGSTFSFSLPIAPSEPSGPRTQDTV